MSGATTGEAASSYQIKMNLRDFWHQGIMLPVALRGSLAGATPHSRVHCTGSPLPLAAVAGVICIAIYKEFIELRNILLNQYVIDSDNFPSEANRKTIFPLGENKEKKMMIRRQRKKRTRPGHRHRFMKASWRGAS